MSVERIANPLRIAGRPARLVATDAPGPLMRLWATAVVAMEQRRARTLIGQMDDRMLRDIGIHRADAERAIRHGRDDTTPVRPWWGR